MYHLYLDLANTDLDHGFCILDSWVEHLCQFILKWLHACESYGVDTKLNAYNKYVTLILKIQTQVMGSARCLDEMSICANLFQNPSMHVRVIERRRITDRRTTPNLYPTDFIVGWLYYFSASTVIKIQSSWTDHFGYCVDWTNLWTFWYGYIVLTSDDLLKFVNKNSQQSDIDSSFYDSWY